MDEGRSRLRSHLRVKRDQCVTSLSFFRLAQMNILFSRFDFLLWLIKPHENAVDNVILFFEFNVYFVCIYWSLLSIWKDGRSINLRIIVRANLKRILMILFVCLFGAFLFLRNVGPIMII